MRDGWGWVEVQGGGLRDIGSQLGGKLCHVVSEERGRVAGAGDGDVAEAGGEQLRVHACIGVNEDAFGSESLGAVAGDGVAVVEMTMLAGVEVDLPIVDEVGGETAIGIDGLDGGQLAIGNPERFVGRGELDAVAHGELAFDLLVDADAG